MNFKQQADSWIINLAHRKRNPVAQSTIDTYEATLTKWIYPALGHLDLGQIDNETVKPFVASLCAADLSAAYVNKILTVVKMVVKSAVSPKGEYLYPRVWNSDFLDVPVICHADQNTPVVTPEAITAAIQGSQGRDRALYALLAGSGLRIAEALSLTVGDKGGNYWDPQAGKVVILPGLAKTDAGAREIDLAPDLNTFLINTIDNTKLIAPENPLFPISYSAALRRMQRLGIQDGFHAFRRFRITHLRKSHVPSGLVQFWAGHSDSASVTDGYDKIKLDVETRKTEAARVGLGFELEAA
jgi:integrase